MKTIQSQIIAEVTSITNSKSFKDWFVSEKAKTPGYLIVINNSFLFRENIKTNKSVKYLSMEIDAKGNYNPSKVFIAEGIHFNLPYKIINPKNIIRTQLKDAIKIELKEIGEIIFTLIGEIQDINEISEEISNADLKRITLSPTQTNDFDFINDELKIKDCLEKEQIWNQVETHFKAKKWNVPENLSLQVSKAITNLQNNAYSNLVIPKSIVSGKEYLMDKISHVVNDHVASYKTKVKNISTDPSAMNEVLRISYNFVSDINKLLTLIVNVCDIKPLICWLTISKHHNLDDRFKELPFGVSDGKPSLITYERLIKNARNRSFHQLFPFNKSLHLEISSIQKVTMRMFSSFSKKSENKITFKDQALYDILLGFTRVTEQTVSDSFWIKNEAVMEAINEVIKATSISIKAVRPHM